MEVLQARKLLNRFCETEKHSQDKAEAILELMKGDHLAEQLVELADALERSLTFYKSSTDDTAKALKRLQSKRISLEVLQATEIGKAVAKLKKHNNKAIRELAKDLVVQWKSVVPQEKATPAPPPRTSTSKPPSKAPDNQSNTTTEPSSSNSIPPSQGPSSTKADPPSSSPSSEAPPPPSDRPASASALDDPPAASTSSPARPGADSTLENDEASADSLDSPIPSSTKRPAPDSSPVPTPMDGTNGTTPTHPPPLPQGFAFKPSGDKDRDKTRDFLLKAFIGSNCEDTNLSPGDVVTEIETKLFDEMKDARDKKYTQRTRMLRTNIEKNAGLREALLSGEIAVDKLLTMSHQELAPDDLQALRAKWAEYHKAAILPDKDNQASTDQFKCGKCGKREATFYQMQTRSADEPMTTFVRCVPCGHRWRF
mmetsp:Transcript_7319/g.12141  ORF Transcript_7319/g.12141 Transcript_7319/m.12141 type:complete len:426 (+) Transcript_7319:749-2026(+)